MKFKSKSSFVLLLAIMILALFVSCEKPKDHPDPNINPVISITSDGGSDTEEGAIVTDNLYENSYLFQQEIFWKASDADGYAEDFAFRVQKKVGDNWVTVEIPGYSSFGTGDNEWYYHFKDGVTIPDDAVLGDPQYENYYSIWSPKHSELINFPANVIVNENGEAELVDQTPHRFQVKCRDNRGGESNIATKYFFLGNYKPTLLITGKKGELSIDSEGNMKTTGLGMDLKFQMTDSDPYVGAEIWYVEYWVDKVTREVVYDGDDSTYVYHPIPGQEIYTYSTKNSSKKNEVRLQYFEDGSTPERPSLDPNTMDNAGNFLDHTRVRAVAYDYAGTPSDTAFVVFNAKEGFTPGTVFYPKRILGLGEYHYSTFPNGAYTLPSTYVSGSGLHYALPLFINKDEKFEAINSSDLRIYMKWGYNGEYVDNDMDNKQENILLDETTGKNYFSEVTYFDLRLDGEPYYYAPIANDPDFRFVDPDGTEWTRVPASHDIGKKTILTLLGPGEHTFTVRAVDSQNIVDPTPAEYTFNIVEPLPMEERKDVLLVDLTPHTNNQFPEVVVDSVYNNLSVLSGLDVDVLDYDEIASHDLNVVNFYGFSTLKSVLSPTDMIGYKTLLIYADNLTNPSSSKMELLWEAFDLYYDVGGNMILSGAFGINTFLDQIVSETNFSVRRWGIDTASEAVTRIGSETENYFAKPYFIGAKGDNGYNDLSMAFPTYNQVINIKGGIGAISIFNMDFIHNAEPIYRIICKDVGDGPLDPSQEEYDMYNDAICGIKTTMNGNVTYLLGFPLSLMDKFEIEAALAPMLGL